MANEFAGMFQNPALIREDRLAALQQQQAAQRQMGGSMSGLLGQVAAGAGGVMAEGLAGMFGLQTAQEKQAEQTQGILNTVDNNDKASIESGIKAAKAAGLSKVATYLEGKAYELTQKTRETAQWDRTVKVWGQQDEDRLTNINRMAIQDARATWQHEQNVLRASRDEQALTLGNAVMSEIGFNPKNPDMVGYYGAMIQKAEEAGRSDLAMQYAVKLDEYNTKTSSKLNETMGVISAKDYTAAGAAELTGMRQRIAKLPLGPERSQLTAQMQQRQDYWAEEAAKVRIAEAKKTAEEKANVEASIKNREGTLNALDQEQAAVADNMQFVSQLGKIVEQAEKGEIYVGFGAEVKLEVSKFAEAIGIDQEEWQTKAANTEQAMTLLSAKILDKIKQLGANPSNADREFLAKTLPMITTSKAGLGKIYEYMRLRALQAREDVKQKQEYVRENNSLRGFESTATAEMAAFLEKEGIDVIKLRAQNSSTPEFSEVGKQQFQSGSIVGQYGGITTYAYPTERISVGMVDDMFKGNPEYVKGSVDDKIYIAMDLYKGLKQAAQDPLITQEEKANMVERLKALDARVRQLVAEGQASVQ